MPVANTRKSRTQDGRSTETLREERNDLSYVQGTNLPNIKPREGMVQRWVRMKLGGEDDDSNIWKRQNQGWEPRAFSTVPQGQRLPKTTFDGIDVIGMKSMILMERSETVHNQFHEMRRSDILRQENAIANDVMRFHDEEVGKKRSSINSQVHKGRGRVPTIEPDE